MKKNSPIAFMLGIVLTQAMLLLIYTLLTLPFTVLVVGSAVSLFLWLDGWRIAKDEESAA